MAFIQVTFDEQANSILGVRGQAFVHTATGAVDSKVHLQVVGGEVAEFANGMSIGGTGLGVLLALVVLLLVFGSIFAAIPCPSFSALFALGYGCRRDRNS